MAAALTPDDYDQLHNFIASRSWDGARLETILADKADALVGGKGAILVIDDVALPKKGSHSVGVAHQYCGALGKQATCQVVVSLTLASDSVPVPVALRLFLPDDWASNAERCRRTGVPADRLARIIHQGFGTAARKRVDGWRQWRGMTGLEGCGDRFVQGHVAPAFTAAA